MSDNQAYISLKEAFEAEIVRRDTIEMNDEIYELKQREQKLNEEISNLWNAIAEMKKSIESLETSK